MLERGRGGQAQVGLVDIKPVETLMNLGTLTLTIMGTSDCEDENEHESHHI